MIFKRPKRVGYFAKRFSVQLADQKPRYAWWQKLLWGLLLIIVVVGAWWLGWSGTFTVRQVRVEGLQTITQAAIEERLNVLGRNILVIDVAGSEAALRALPSIREVALVRSLPDTIRVIIREREPVLAWGTTDQLYLVDQKGLPYRLVTQLPAGLYRVVDTANIHVDIGQQAVPTSFTAAFANIVPALNELYGDTLDHFEVGETVYDLDAVLRDGHRVKMNVLSNITNQLAELARIKEKRADLFNRAVIDLRVDRWAYIR